MYIYICIQIYAHKFTLSYIFFLIIYTTHDVCIHVCTDFPRPHWGFSPDPFPPAGSSASPPQGPQQVRSRAGSAGSFHLMEVGATTGSSEICGTMWMFSMFFTCFFWGGKGCIYIYMYISDICVSFLLTYELWTMKVYEGFSSGDINPGLPRTWRQKREVQPGITGPGHEATTRDSRHGMV
jgi:hypothetical protein